MEDFNTIITDTINAAAQGLTRRMDCLLLGDIKRMTDNGTLTIEIEQPEFKPFDGTAMSVEQGGRVRFTGEETIEAQAKRIQELEAELEATHQRLMESKLCHCHEDDRIGSTAVWSCNICRGVQGDYVAEKKDENRA